MNQVPAQQSQVSSCSNSIEMHGIILTNMDPSPRHGRYSIYSHPAGLPRSPRGGGLPGSERSTGGCGAGSAGSVWSEERAAGGVPYGAIGPWPCWPCRSLLRPSVVLVGFCTAAVFAFFRHMASSCQLYRSWQFSENAVGSWPQEELEYSLNESQERLSCISSVTTSTQAWQDIVNYLYRLYMIIHWFLHYICIIQDCIRFYSAPSKSLWLYPLTTWGLFTGPRSSMIEICFPMVKSWR